MRRYLTQRLWVNLLLLGVTVALVWSVFELWENFRQRHGQFEPVRDARIVEARCKRACSLRPSAPSSVQPAASPRRSALFPDRLER